MENSYAMFQFYLRQQQKQGQLRSSPGQIVNYKTTARRYPSREKPALLKDTMIALLRNEFFRSNARFF